MKKQIFKAAFFCQLFIAILLTFILLPTDSYGQFTPLWTPQQTSNPSTNNGDAANAITANASGIYVVGSSGNSYWHIEKRDLTTGALIAAFGTAGVVTHNLTSVTNAYAITADASGIYVAGDDIGAADFSYQWRIEKRDLITGALIPGFGIAGVVQNNPSANWDDINAITADGSGIYVVGHDRFPGVNDYRWRIEKRNLTTGALIWTGTSDPSVWNDDALAITADASGVYVAGYDLSTASNKWRIEKRNLTTGALDAAFGTAGVIISGAWGSIANAITADASGIYVVGSDFIPGNYQWRIEKRNLTTGALDAAFGTAGVVQNNPSGNDDRAQAITIDGTGIYVAGFDRSLGSTNAQWRIEKRDLTTGALLCTQLSNITAGNDNAYAITIDGSGIYVAGNDRIPGNDEWRIEKYDRACTILPVELLYFNAFPENNSIVRTEWSTASEINNDYFTIERSKYGTTFEQIGTMQGAGNSSITLNYVFYDEHPYAGISYYRLKQTDYDGQYAYSAIRQVYIGRLEIITIYPNPSSEYIQYVVGSEAGGIVTVQVMDVLGREVISQEETLEGGAATKKLSTVTLSSGSYLLRITTKTLEKTQKQFVVK